MTDQDHDPRRVVPLGRPDFSEEATVVEAPDESVIRQLIDNDSHHGGGAPAPSGVRRLISRIARLPSGRMPAQDRRSSERIPASVDAVLTTPTGRKFAFRTLNLSTGGLFIAARVGDEVPIRVGVVCSVRLLGAQRTVDFEAELIRKVDGGGSALAARGFSFQIVRLTSEQQVELGSLIKEASQPKGQRRRRRFRLAYVVVPLLAAGGIAGGFYYAKNARRGLDVQVVKVGRGNVEEMVSSSSDGEVMATQRAIIRAAFPTKIQQVHVKRGDRVTKDDLLVTLDEASLRDALGDAQAKLRVAEARFRQAQQTVRVASNRRHLQSQLLKKGATTEEALSEANDAVASAAAAAQVARAAVEDARTTLAARSDQLTRNSIRAPFDGVVAEVQARVGDTLATSAPISELVDDSRLHVEVPFEEADALRVKEGMTARIVLQGVSTPVDGVVRRVSPTVRTDQKGGRSVTVEIDIKSKVKLRAGMTANADVVVDRRENVVVLPAQYVVGHGAKRVVYVATADGRADSRPIAIGFSNPDTAEIISGVSEGEQVITNVNAKGLAAGARVTIKRDEAADRAP